MPDHKSVEKPSIQVGNKLSSAFDRLQDSIRERAYYLFQERGSDRGDSMADWLDAQWELLTPVELEVKEQKKNIVVEGNLKGFSTQDIEIEVEGNLLKVFGSHSQSDEGKKGDVLKSTSSSAYFYQSVRLPAPVDPEASHAKLFKNGKLRVTLPKAVVAKN